MATSLHLDVAAPDSGERLLTYLRENTAGLDVLVHNAGITRDKLLANMKPEQWDSVIAVNLESQLRINAALLDSDQLNDAGARRHAVLDHGTVRQPRADELRRHQGRGHRHGPLGGGGLRRGTAARRSTRSRPASSTPT